MVTYHSRIIQYKIVCNICNGTDTGADKIFYLIFIVDVYFIYWSQQIGSSKKKYITGFLKILLCIVYVGNRLF